jgi:uncharacterized protein YoxC
MEVTITVQDLFLIIAGLSIVAITVVLIPFLVQLKQTGRRAEKLMENIDKELEPLLVSLKITAAQLQDLSENINGKLAETDAIIKTARHAGESLLVTTSLLKTVLTPTITKVGGITSGIRAFMSFMHRSDRGRKEREAKANE